MEFGLRGEIGERARRHAGVACNHEAARAQTHHHNMAEPTVQIFPPRHKDVTLTIVQVSHCCFLFLLLLFFGFVSFCLFLCLFGFFCLFVFSFCLDGFFFKKTALTADFWQGIEFLKFNRLFQLFCTSL